MTFSFIPPGSFLMGSDHPKGEYDEKAVHRVTLTKGFFLGIHPVTQAQWRAITGESPSHFQGDNRPVEQVSWDDCQEFCQKLTAHRDRLLFADNSLQITVNPSGLTANCKLQTVSSSGRWTASLPTEAEWEYACRAGTTTEFHFGDVITTELANYDGNYTWNGSPEGKYREETTEVGSFPANPWGLHDMHGNVWEWCQDGDRPYSLDNLIDPISLQEQSNGRRVLRGGSWDFSAGDCRAASRSYGTPDRRSGSNGFRVCFRLD